MLQRPSLPHTPGPHPPASPPHNPHPRALPLKPRKSPPPPLPHCTQARGRLHLRHMQVCCHHHPITAHKICPRCQLATCKPTMTPSQHGTQGLPCCRPAVRKPCCGTTLTRNARSCHRRPTAMPPWHAGPPHHAIPNTVRKTATATNDHNNGDDDGAVVGTVVMGDSGIAAAAMAVTARHSYYFRLYIFYLCNKWIIFLYFV